MNTVSFVKDNHQVPKKWKSKHYVCSACGHSEKSVESSDDSSYTNPLSLDDYFVQHPSATFFVKVGEQEDAPSVQENPFLGVAWGDILTIDRAIQPTLGRLVVAVCDGAFTLCRFTEHEGHKFLLCGTDACSAQELHDDGAVSIWGVVASISRKV